jgi:hypothetical protein
MNRRLMSREDVVNELRFPSLLDNALRAGWIKAVGSTGGDRAGKFVFSSRDVDALVDRLLRGEFPPVSRAKGKEEAS